MPESIFELAGERARQIIAMLKYGVPPTPIATSHVRKYTQEYCVMQHGVCITHGNADSQCALDRA